MISSTGSAPSAQLPASPSARGSLAAPAVGPVLLVAAALAAALLLTSHRYGYFGDELYFLAAGQHLSWGYADQGPAVPLIARMMQTLAPGSLVVLRIPPLLATVGCVVLAAAMARELGGNRRAQVLAAGACAISPHFLGSGHLLATWSFDQALWALITWLLLRWVRLHARGDPDDRLLLGAGLVTAAALQVKFLIPAFWLALAVAVLTDGPRVLLRRPLLWAGGGVAVLASVPALVWQATHGWPQASMTETVATETGSAWSFLAVAGNQAGAVGAVLAVLGLWFLLRAPGLRQYRFLAGTTLLLLVVFLTAGGRPYYIAGLYPLLFAAAVVGLQHHRVAAGVLRRGWLMAGIYGVSAGMAMTALPILPASTIRPSEVVSTASLGWPELTADVAEAYRTLPPGQRPDTAVLTHDYWSAAAIRHYGPQRGIAEVYSPSRGFWYFGRPSAATEQVVYLGADRSVLARHFRSVRRVGTVRTGQAVATYYEGMPIWVARGPEQPWPVLWPRLQHMSLWG
ncbi:dolichyl-phosphate-mannose-protein mannosyltransferase [Halopolyspora algeriensis]|uniref:Dolichyl-phosphate-mannose-protein mannosyltransferase n=1 Tax=Halopolyspora algeriensis TaxID=1500506 RepID=A0A368VXT0_9ACTN|nr:glycosyltransferase family 39 protein [Halopolyspora algeriensis]RCW46117.1 dolichyl-phosphate-mannose-protein mannosyltransferase [Halopolyspora algeriensis]TQM55520.1 dolichyl-phosphate-mannose-protein mannosyltransferase [Halopolyspora algeriensis]